jgi:indolepyruvate ferredoxin oxidoreductase
VVDRDAVEALAKPASSSANDAEHLSESISEVVARREKYLKAYQSAAYARRYRAWVDKVIGAESLRAPGKSGLGDAVARYLFKLMAYKDEYEVARLYTDGAFANQVKNAFDGDNLRLEFHLAPPILARYDPATGLPRKMSFGPWLMPAFRVLAKLKFLRGTALDPFGRTLERRTERQLISDYETMLTEVLAKLTPENHHLAVGLAAIPEKIRGFGHVKQRHLTAAKADEAALFEQFRAGGENLLKAAE